MPPTDITEDEAIRVATEALEETKNHASGIGPYKVENAEFLIASAALDALSRHKDKATVTDPRDEALRVAVEALNEAVCWVPDGTRKSPLERGAKLETVHDLRQMIIAAIRLAGGAR